jgi:hypothetical protein
MDGRKGGRLFRITRFCYWLFGLGRVGHAFFGFFLTLGRFLPYLTLPQILGAKQTGLSFLAAGCGGCGVSLEVSLGENPLGKLHLRSLHQLTTVLE